MDDNTLDLGQWFILRMASADTLKVTDALRKRGFEVWTPIERKRARTPRTRTEYDRELAIMPSYAFASVHNINAIRHLADLPQRDVPRFSVFQYGGGVPLIASDDLGALRQEEGRLQGIYERLVRRGKKGPKLEAGQTIRLTEGPFAGMDGVVEDQQGQLTLVSFEGFHKPIKISSLLLLESVAAEERAATKAA